MKKLFTVVILIVSMVVSCGGGSAYHSNANEIKVGVPLPLTGDLAQYGQSIKEGIQLKLDELNEAGGVNNKKFVVDYEDSKGDIQEDVNIFKQMVGNHLDVILGEAASANSLAVAELAQKAKVPMIVPAATALDVNKDKDYVYRISFTDPYQGKILADYVKKQGVDRVAVLTNSSVDYSVGVSEAFIKEAESLGLETYELEYTKEDKDFKTLLTDVKNKGYKAVVLPDYYNTVGLILSQVKEVGLKAQFYGGDGWDGIQENFAKVAEGSIFASQFVDDDSLPQTKEFIKSYKKKFSKEPTIFAALGYDAATVLGDALTREGDVDKLKETLKSTNLDLVTGHVTFDESRNPKKEVLFVQVKDGKVILKEKFGE